ncbi:rho GTPase-activating protein 28 isoform X4 [Mauremys reevesii]|nr:rho GTPase-activating protein 28 isoform X4 [Mauremys reevesii]XP_039382965.1 rho GTPase-activating protein 28 isoform X4 [Mauremys reevesii]XP_039382966.1 rho GTPase-activating protein 28 isoform X4 [Mauremys reevesii]XP_039382967.1 rho GTPase-activating protein 28 isoform X4 [Mauremys reevesii]XP_039382968.1 rho GTPase-activating protein 28 isoform X4 [Mauremys reevesii]XP_039382969.1 rho GTPase-activating protein 28 isoform X4 [Mauremys reevesii]
MLSNESLRPPMFSRSNSQASVDSTSMEDFWCEVESIKENSEQGQEEQTLLEVKPADEGELEAEWLQDVGLSTLISGAEEEDGQALLSTLTRTQAAAVQRRYNTYTQTMRKKNKHSVRDVRDIFGVNDSSPTFETVPVSPVPSNGIQLPGQKPVWKSVSSNSCLDCGLDKDSPSVKEELSYEVSFSESITVVPKNRERQNNQRFKKDDSALPNFIVRKSQFGLTEVGDLSLEDMKKIRNLSLIELTAFYDALGIELKRNRTERIKGRENGLFGVPLAILLENDQKKVPGIKVPLIFQKLLLKLEETGLEMEGILRVPGSASRVKNLRQEIEIKFNEDTFDWDQVRNNDAAGLLKMFIRELPNPLFTVEYLPAFITLVEKVSKVKLQLQALHLLIMLLPDANRDTAKAFLQFLKKIVANEGKNKMNLWNVSMIVAPNVFIYKGKHANQEEMHAAATTAHIVRLLIKYQDILWTVPSFLISQVRKMNEATMNNTKRQMIFDKGVRRLLRRKTMERERPERSETHIPEGVIRVYAPLHSKVSMAIQLNSQTKARDILARFHCENSHASSKNMEVQIQRLYEIGGNIGLHCLDPDAYMLDVYRANPQAEWVIKPKSS